MSDARPHPELERFDSGVPVEQAETPPSSWYVSAELYELELRGVLEPAWQLVGPAVWLDEPGAFCAQLVGGQPVVVLRDEAGTLRALANVCRHHAAELVQGRGQVPANGRLVCPYHGWEYDLTGRLRRAPRMGGVEGFSREASSLPQLEVGTWGPLLFARARSGGPGLDAWLAASGLAERVSGLRFVARRSYELACNWKVYVDNYLDGGYHVDVVHQGLADQLELGSYHTEVVGHTVLQSCASGDEPDEQASTGSSGADFADRLTGGAVYAWVYPNLMLNRYGPFLDTNLVLPVGPERCVTIFDYYVEPDALAERGDDFLERSLAASEQVQLEDINVCESVQRGLRSSFYETGRYAPRLEHGMFHFHRLLAADLNRAASEWEGCSG